jgi:putative protease
MLSCQKEETMAKRIGTVTHYYTHLGVAVLDLTGDITLGDEIHISGHITDLVMHVQSMEIEHQKVESAGPGMEVALKVDDYVRAGDEVYQMG